MLVNTKSEKLQNYQFYIAKVRGVLNSRREYMFIGKYRKISFNPEGIICKIALPYIQSLRD